MQDREDWPISKRGRSDATSRLNDHQLMHEIKYVHGGEKYAERDMVEVRVFTLFSKKAGMTHRTFR